MIKAFLLLFISFHLYAQNAFVSVQELKSMLHNQNLVILDVSDFYKKGHIKGAISLDVNYLINKNKSYNALKSHRRLLEIFAQKGLREDSNIIIYGRNNFHDLKASAFLAFVLYSSGFEKVSILDGAYMSIVFEDASLITNKIPEQKSGKAINLDYNNYSVDFEYVQKNLHTINLIDARDANDFVQGHIESASTCSYRLKFKKDFTILPRERIQYACLGYIKDLSKVVIYSNDIFTSALEWFIINRVFGFKEAKIYYNSLAEYRDLGLAISSYK